MQLLDDQLAAHLLLGVEQGLGGVVFVGDLLPDLFIFLVVVLIVCERLFPALIGTLGGLGLLAAVLGFGGGFFLPEIE